MSLLEIGLLSLNPKNLQYPLFVQHKYFLFYYLSDIYHKQFYHFIKKELKNKNSL